jgi:L-cysteine desulfidase
MFSAVFSSQDRCVAPSKTFSGSTGYGCFAYIPLMYYEDARVIDEETFTYSYVYYYSVPGMFMQHTRALISIYDVHQLR